MELDGNEVRRIITELENLLPYGNTEKSWGHTLQRKIYTIKIISKGKDEAEIIISRRPMNKSELESSIGNRG